ncbi:MAG: hypothetical protein EBS29_05085 [Chloroflexia bacterium]|nr:hypothetical protein [Chloroflexia bacterium]
MSLPAVQHQIDSRRRDDRVVGVRQRTPAPNRTAPSKPRRPRRNVVWQWFALGLLGCLLGILLWAVLLRMTITLIPPLGEARVVSLTDVDFPIVAIGKSDRMQIEAVRLASTVTITETGEALTEVPMPDGRAKGKIMVINMLEQAVTLPVGTEFVASGSGGEVRFMLDAPVKVPPAVTTSTLTSRTTEFGQFEVAVTARSAGSASNVGEDKVTTLLLPGQGPITSDNGQIILRNASITGGSETMRRIVSEGDEARLLGAALTKAYAQGMSDLTAQATQRMLQIDDTTVNPSPIQLGQPQVYGEPQLTPAVGTLLDPRNAEMRITVQVTFNAYAIKADQTIQSQLQQVVPQRFQGGSTPICRVGELSAFKVAEWHPTATAIVINGEIRCSPQMPIPAAVVNDLPKQLQGVSNAQARTLLDALKTKGIISGYTLPPRDQLPPLPQLITVRIGEATTP